MAEPLRRIGILTGGGDCPGLNAVIRGVVKTAVFQHQIDVIGIENGYWGLVNDRMRPLATADVGGILARGGTILGSSNRDNPFRVPVIENGEKVYRDLSDQAIKNAQRHGLQVLIAVGGDGSLSIARDLSGRGIRMIGVPKTIDNDLGATDVTFGFDSALAVATEAVDRLHTTAMSHQRVMVLEVMGRYAGWIALEAGLAGGGDVILIPEIPFEIEHVAEAIRERIYHGRPFAIIVVAEGAQPKGGSMVVTKTVADSTDPVRLGGIGQYVASELERLLDLETRATVLGHLQRGGVPTPFDRILGTRFGVAAVKAAVAGETDVMVRLRGREIETVPLVEAVKDLRRVDPEGNLVQAARSVGTCFGDSPSTAAGAPERLP
jgi:ATP-dependent phosphofructokinase / diphosphate-dependent phosphofructokinase